MRLKRTFVPLGIVVFLCAVALGYLYMHNRSLMLTEEISDLEIKRQFKVEKLGRTQAELDRLRGFAHLESLWVAAGRPEFVPQTEPDRVASKETDSLPVMLALRNGSSH